MTSVEQRVVQMKFDNAQFGTGIASTLNQLASLKSALRLEGASAGLNEVNNAAGRLSTAGAQQQVSALGSRFTALQAVALTALSNIVNRAVDAGLRLANSLSLQPVMDGFREYETNLGSIQTILANTGLKGAEGLGKVTDVLDELNHYSDQTIYNFSEMAKNIGTFTAAGVGLEASASAIKGISNLAAISGSTSEQASAAMYQLSQALSAGKVSLEDWNSVVNSGMGGKVFQDSLIQTAKAHGVAVDQIIKDAGSFRMSLQEGWITSEILTETLSKFTGELTADQLKSMGYTEQQIAGIMEMAKTATDAATKVKSMSQLLDTLREAAGSGWAQTWKIVFGDFDEAKELFTGVNNVLGGMISRSAEARNNLLQGWKDLGGRDALIQGIANAFKALMAILKPIKDAFRDIFPKTTAKQLYDMTVSFRDFMERLKIGEETANNLRRTFAGFFAILGIGWELIKAGVGFIFDLVGSLTSGSGGFLEFTGNIGDFLVALHKAIKEGDAFGKMFEFLGKILSFPIKLLHLLGSLLGALFDGINADGATQSVKGLTEALSPLERIGNYVAGVWERVKAVFTDFLGELGPVAQGFVEWVSSIGKAIASGFDGMNFDAVMSGFQTGLLAGILLFLKQFVGKITDLFSNQGGIFDGVTNALDKLSGTLQGMQNALNAHALLMIAAAVGILTLSLIALGKMDSASLTRASVAIGVMFTQLGIAFAAFAKISTGPTALKVGVMSAGLILLATAVRILASAVEKLSGIPIEQLRRGLIALAILLTTLVTATNKLQTNTAGMIRTASGIVILAAAIRILVESVEELGKLDWNSLAKGLVGVGALLTSLALFTRIAELNKAGVSSGIGIVLLATGLKILASAVGDFTKFNWEQIARGMSGVAIGLGLLAGALNLLPSGAIFKAAGLVIVATSLQLIADGVKKMSGLRWDEIARGMTVMAGSLIAIAGTLKLIPSGSVLSAAAVLVVATSLGLIQKALGNMAGMTWEEIAKGLVVLAGSLLIIAAAVRVMQGALSGAAAVLVVAASLRMLVPVLVTLGQMSWEEIIKGLVALAGVFTIMGLAGLLLAPLAPVIFSLAGGIALLGLAVLAAGVGVLAFATGLTVLAAAGTGAVAAIVGIVAGLVGLIPYVMEQIALGLVAFAKVIAVSGPAIVGAITTVLNSFLDAILNATPKIVNTLVSMLLQMLNALADAVPKFVDAAARIITGFLNGVAKNIGKVVDAGVNLAVKFLEAIGRNAGKVIQAGIDLVFDVIAGIADGIRNSGERIIDAGIDIATALIEGVVRGIGQLVKRAVEAAINVAKSMWEGIQDFFGIFSPSRKMIWMSKQLVLGMILGLDRYGHRATAAAVDMSSDVMESMTNTLSGLGSIIGDEVVDLQPTITPVLDLTGVKNNANEISRILALPALDVASVYTAARNADAEYEDNRSTDTSDEMSGSGGDSYYYTQNNTSPKALSEAEIYRKTKNLLSRTKEDSNA